LFFCEEIQNKDDLPKNEAHSHGGLKRSSQAKCNDDTMTNHIKKTTQNSETNG